MQKHHVIGGGTLLLTLLGIGFLFLWVPPHIEQLTQFVLDHPILAPFLLIVWRILSIVIPPIPGGIVSIALIPVVGWFWSYTYGLIGVIIGTSLAFFIARKYREPVVKKFFPLQQLHKWEGKLSRKTEFMAFLGLRLTTGPLLDFMSYVAGLSKISYNKFILATVLSELPQAFIYFLGGEAYERFAEKSIYLGIGSILLLIVAISVIKNHELFKKRESK